MFSINNFSYLRKMNINLRVLFFGLFFSSLLTQNFFSQEEKSKAELFVIQGVKDSAKVYISKIKNQKYKSLLNNLNNNTASYSDYYQFATRISLYGKPQFKQLVRFLEKRINYPENTKVVNLDFVKLKATQIEIIANEIELKDANKENQKLKKYLQQIKNKKSTDYEHAKLYGEIHTSLINMIRQNPKGFELNTQYEKKALQLNDVFLALKFRDVNLNYYMANNDLEGYIRECKKSLAIEEELEQKSPLYEVTISHLLDALIFKSTGRDEYVEQLLLKLFYDKKSHYSSYSLLAKYVSHLPVNDPGALKIYQLVGTKNVSDFCFELERRATGKVNQNEMYYLLMECSAATYYQGDYKNCFYFKNNQLFLNKAIYSTELSQTIADYQVREVELEKEFKIKQEKEKGKLYLIIVFIVVLFLVVSIYFVVIYVKKSRILKIRNDEKEMLVKEINHRVKNNFQLVNSLLELQSKDIGNEIAIQKLNEGQSRIKAMSLIHQKLYQTEYLGLVSFKEYTQQLTDLLLSTVNFKNVTTRINIDDIQLDIDTAIPLGLILNELFTNSIKYALKDEPDEFIEITIKKQDSTSFLFEYKDSGTGFNLSLPPKETGLGMKLIKSLIKQLQGEIKPTNQQINGMIFIFKDKIGRKQID